VGSDPGETHRAGQSSHVAHPPVGPDAAALAAELAPGAEECVVHRTGSW